MTQALTCGREKRTSCCSVDRQEAGLAGSTSPFTQCPRSCAEAGPC